MKQQAGKQGKGKGGQKPQGALVVPKKSGPKAALTVNPKPTAKRVSANNRSEAKRTQKTGRRPVRPGRPALKGNR